MPFRQPFLFPDTLSTKNMQLSVTGQKEKKQTPLVFFYDQCHINYQPFPKRNMRLLAGD